jgi:tRNA pseudouridine32 synthase/23S rRNA pseudouridine746 synthase
VHHRLVQRFPGCTLVHRLDFGTSGLMVVARNKGINALLCQQFSQRTVAKVYTALLCGHLAEDEGIVRRQSPKIRPVSRACRSAPGTANRRVRAIGS